MKKISTLLAVLIVALSASAAFAFDPSLVTQDGFGAKVETEIGQYGLDDSVPVGTLQLYGAGATYGIKNLGTKITASVGGAVLNVDQAFETRDYQAAAPYVSLGVSQQVYELFGVKLGLFVDGTYVFNMKDTYEGIGVGIEDLNIIRTGAVAQYEVMKDLNVYAGINGQWLNGSVKVEGESQTITNNSNFAGFGGVKYDFKPFTFDLNAAFSDRPHVSANISYNF